VKVIERLEDDSMTQVATVKVRNTRGGSREVPFEPDMNAADAVSKAGWDPMAGDIAIGNNPAKANTPLKAGETVILSPQITSN
jgi:hypothetical protein